MKRIYLTEILDEVLGVPEGIIETSRDIYESIIKGLKQKSSGKLKDPSSVSIRFRKSDGFQVADYNFKAVIVHVTVQSPQNGRYKDNRIYWSSMGFRIDPLLKPPYKAITMNMDKDLVEIDIFVETNKPEEYSWDDIVDFMSGSEKINIMTSLAHEFKHAYDKYKKKNLSASSIVKYATVAGAGRSIPGLTEFMHYLYYTTLTEHLVRPTEVAAYLKYNNATKKDFLEILKKTQLYDNAKKAQNFTYEKMIQDALSSPDIVSKIKEFFKDKLNTNIDNLSDEDTIKRYLQKYFVDIKQKMGDIYQSLVHADSSSLDLLKASLGIDSNDVMTEKRKAIEEFQKAVNKYSDDQYETFYRKEITKINYNAEKILKKVAKLYDYI